MRWQMLTEQRLLDIAVGDNRSERRQVAAPWEDAKGRQRDLRLAVEQTKHDQRENGGDRLEQLRLELETLADRRMSVQQRRTKFDERVGSLPLAVDSDEDLFTAQLAAEEFLAGFPDRETELEGERTRLYEDGSPLTVRREEIVKDLESLRGRKGSSRGRC